MQPFVLIYNCKRDTSNISAACCVPFKFRLKEKRPQRVELMKVKVALQEKTKRKICTLPIDATEFQIKPCSRCFTSAHSHYKASMAKILYEGTVSCQLEKSQKENQHTRTRAHAHAHTRTHTHTVIQDSSSS